MTIAVMPPGPIAINSATFVGIRVAGPRGAVVATPGCVLPSCIIVMAFAHVCYHFKGLSAIQGILSGLRPGVGAMIAAAGLGLLFLTLYGSRELPIDFSALNVVSSGILTVVFSFFASGVSTLSGS